MTRAELLDLIDQIIEQKLLEILNDPDENLELEPMLREQLLRQQQAVAEGEIGRPLDEAVTQHIGFHA